MLFRYITFSAASSVPSPETRFGEAFAQAEKALKVCKSENQVYNNSHLMYGADTEDKLKELDRTETEKNNGEERNTALKS